MPESKNLPSASSSLGPALCGALLASSSASSRGPRRPRRPATSSTLQTGTTPAASYCQTWPRAAGSGSKGAFQKICWKCRLSRLLPFYTYPWGDRKTTRRELESSRNRRVWLMKFLFHWLLRDAAVSSGGACVGPPEMLVCERNVARAGSGRRTSHFHSESVEPQLYHVRGAFSQVRYWQPECIESAAAAAATYTNTPNPAATTGNHNQWRSIGTRKKTHVCLVEEVCASTSFRLGKCFHLLVSVCRVEGCLPSPKRSITFLSKRQISQHDSREGRAGPLARPSPDPQRLLFKGMFGREGEQTPPKLSCLTVVGFRFGGSSLVFRGPPGSSTASRRHRAAAAFLHAGDLARSHGLSPLPLRLACFSGEKEVRLSEEHSLVSDRVREMVGGDSDHPHSPGRVRTPRCDAHSGGKKCLQEDLESCPHPPDCRADFRCWPQANNRTWRPGYEGSQRSHLVYPNVLLPEMVAMDTVLIRTLMFLCRRTQFIVLMGTTVDFSVFWLKKERGKKKPPTSGGSRDLREKQESTVFSACFSHETGVGMEFTPRHQGLLGIEARGRASGWTVTFHFQFSNLSVSSQVVYLREEWCQLVLSMIWFFYFCAEPSLGSCRLWSEC